MVAIAFLNATLRQLVFVSYFGELDAHQLSTITLIILCSIYVVFIFPYLGIEDGKHALLSGFTWAVLTVLFEFSLGLATNRSWSDLLQDYNIAAGRIWLLFLVWLSLLPYGIFVFRKRLG